MTADVYQPQPPMPEVVYPEQRVRGRSPWTLAWERLRRDRAAMISLGVIVCIGLIAIFAGVISHAVGHPPNHQYRSIGLSPAGIPKSPNSTFLLGTDDLGRDILVRVCYGARISLLIGAICSGLSCAAGVIIGLLSGYLGGVVDTILSRLMDVVLSFPFLLAAVALAAVLGPSLGVEIAVIAFFSWAAVGRIIRGQTLSAKEREYVEAARSLGARDLRIMFVDILPNLMAPLIVYATILIPISIVFGATISFLGLGVPPPTATWGNMLSDAIDYYTVSWWFLAFPGAALLLTTLAFNLLGDSVRDALDPRSKLLTESV
ncbi:MAG: ABC transporter permease [Streptosporangiaceae bacterium]